jgi:hypothetical protein
VTEPADLRRTLQAAVEATLGAMTATAAAIAPPVATATPALAATEAPLPSPTATATITPTAIPAQALLSGITHEYQKFNNCGRQPMAPPSGAGRRPSDTAAFGAPANTKNVSPGEMVLVSEKTDRRLCLRGGDLEMLKSIAAGFRC